MAEKTDQSIEKRDIDQILRDQGVIQNSNFEIINNSNQKEKPIHVGPSLDHGNFGTGSRKETGSDQRGNTHRPSHNSNPSQVQDANPSQVQDSSGNS